MMTVLRKPATLAMAGLLLWVTPALGAGPTTHTDPTEPSNFEGSTTSFNGGNDSDTWKSGRTYLVTDDKKAIEFGGKEITLPQGTEFTFQDGFLVISLSKNSPRDAAVVKVGRTYLVVTKREKLVLDPHGAPRNPRYAFRYAPNRTPTYRFNINNSPNASPFEP